MRALREKMVWRSLDFMKLLMEFAIQVKADWLVKRITEASA